MEQVARVLFLWRSEVEEQRECASDMRRRNEALVYNILPPHVAEHFMGNRKRQHDELYSQSYAEVGVLFASMPNFSGRWWCVCGYTCCCFRNKINLSIKSNSWVCLLRNCVSWREELKKYYRTFIYIYVHTYLEVKFTEVSGKRIPFIPINT